MIDDHGAHAIHGVAGILALEGGEAGVEPVIEETDHHAGVIALALDWIGHIEIVGDDAAVGHRGCDIGRLIREDGEHRERVPDEARSVGVEGLAVDRQILVGEDAVAGVARAGGDARIGGGEQRADAGEGGVVVAANAEREENFLVKE